MMVMARRHGASASPSVRCAAAIVALLPFVEGTVPRRSRGCRTSGARSGSRAGSLAASRTGATAGVRAGTARARAGTARARAGAAVQHRGGGDVQHRGPGDLQSSSPSAAGAERAGSAGRTAAGTPAGTATGTATGALVDPWAPAQGSTKQATRRRAGTTPRGRELGSSPGTDHVVGCAARPLHLAGDLADDHPSAREPTTPPPPRQGHPKATAKATAKDTRRTRAGTDHATTRVHHAPTGARATATTFLRARPATAGAELSRPRAGIRPAR